MTGWRRLRGAKGELGLQEDEELVRGEEQCSSRVQSLSRSWLRVERDAVGGEQSSRVSGGIFIYFFIV